MDYSSMAVKTGYSILAHGEYMKEFEWSSKSPHNSITSVMGRLFSSKLRPDPIILNRFTRMSDRVFKYMNKEFDKIAYEKMD